MNAKQQLKRVELSKKLRSDFSYRTASMGNFFYVEKINKASYFSVSDEKKWPGQDRSSDFGSGSTYSKSSNQSAKWVNFTLYLQAGYDFRFIGGLLTVFRKKDYNRNAPVKCVWFEQSKGFSLNKVSGYIYKEHHIKASSESEAFNKIKSIRDKAACKLKLQRVSEKIDLSRIWVSFKDSIAAENCEAGTKNFAQRHGIDLEKIGGVRADWLLEIGKSDLSYVNKAIAFAKMRYAKLLFS